MIDALLAKWLADPTRARALAAMLNAPATQHLDDEATAATLEGTAPASVLHKPVALEELLAFLIDQIGQQSDPAEILLLCIVDRMLQELAAVTVATMLPVNNDVFQENRKSPLRSADGKKQVDHPQNQPVFSQHENPTSAGLL